MSLTETMRQKAEADLRQAEADAEAAKAAHLAAEERLAEMRAVCGWLQSFGRAENGEGRPVELRFGRPVPEVTNTKRCLDALEKLGGRADNGQIRVAANRDGGPPLDQVQVRGTMKHLAKKKPSPVVSVGTGIWKLQATGADMLLAGSHAQTSTPFRAVTAPTMNGAGRES